VAAYGYDWVYSLESCNISNVGQANTLSGTAHIMTELLEHEAPWKGKSELPHGGHSSNRDASQPGNHTAKVLPIWPTPTADAWAKKSKIALRAFTTLHWLHSKTQLKLQQRDSSYGAACTGLKQQLALLLHMLLTGHLADAQLDMTDFVGCGMTSIPLMLESNQPQYPPLTSFAESFLHRLAANQSALAKLSIVSPAYGEGTRADTQGVLSLWRIVCERSSPKAWTAFIHDFEICSVMHQL